MGEVAAVLEVLVRDLRRIEHTPRAFRRGVLAHADDDDRIRSDRGLDLAHDVSSVCRDLLANCGMDAGFFEDRARHARMIARAMR